MRYTVSRVMIFLLASLVLVPSPGSGAPDDRAAQPVKTDLPALKVVGNQLVNEKNEPVRLRGVNCASLEWTSDGQGHIVETVRVAIRDWNVNHVRLPLSQDRWFGKAPEQEDGGQAYRALVDEIVNLCASNDVYVMLDLHWSNKGEWGKFIGQHSMPDRHSLTFWKDLAPRYANHPAVIYDLYNEPHDVSWDVWLRGGNVMDRPNTRQAGPASEFEAVGMQTLLDRVRACGARNLVVVGGLDWSYDVSGILEGRQLEDPTGNGLIYANHCYNNKNQAVETWIANMETAAAKFPIIISEFGGAYFAPGTEPPRRGRFRRRRNDGDWLLRVLHAIEDHGWSYTAWDLHPAAGPTLIADWDYTPSPYFGVYVKQMLHGTLPAYTPPPPTEVAASKTQEEAVRRPSAAPSSRDRRRGLRGDWNATVEFGEREVAMILSFHRDADGKWKGRWISFWGLIDLENVRFEDGVLRFVQVVRFGDNQIRSEFAGTVAEGKLSGTLRNDRGDSRVRGRRSPRVSRAVGDWNMRYTVGGREIAATLAVRSTEAGGLTGEWRSSIGKHEISNLAYERGRLTFERKSHIEDREWTSRFEGTTDRGAATLTGVIRSEFGEIDVEGKRVQSPLHGDWRLDIGSEQRNYAQRLRVYPDMSGLFGTVRVDKVHLDGDTVRFKVPLEFGGQRFDMDFEGRLTDSGLTGRFATSRGAQQVKGRRMAP